jgi:hypothetical protein
MDEDPLDSEDGEGPEFVQDFLDDTGSSGV